MAVDVPAIDSKVPGSVGNTDGCEIPAISVLPDVAMAFVCVPLPAVAAVAVAADPTAIPPPS